jgi:hypothetical protein
MTAAATPKGLHAKLAEVMAEADRIPKNGKYQGQGAFAYVLVGDAADAIRGALGTRGVSMLPTSVEIIGEAEHETRSGGTMTTLSIRTTWTLTDSETGQVAVIQSIGTGADSGDKASPKAQTNAMKYALLMGFLLSTGDDPEQADTSDRKARRGAAQEPDEKPAAPEYVSQGHKAYTGIVAKGDGQFNDVEYHQTPSGHLIGFRLNIEGGSAIHEVLCTGPIGEAMFVGVPIAELLGSTVDVEGEAYRIDQAGRRPRARLVVSRIKAAGFTIPAEAESLPLFDAEQQAAVDAALDAVLA